MSKEKIYGRITDFYSGKSILITGAIGFLGEVLIETFLRCCLDIRTIYILVRPKKGKTAEERVDEMLNKSLFSTLKAQNPDAFQKLHFITGDVIHPDLGINPDDLQKICEEVSIVFHCAASISFLRPLRFLLTNNVLGLKNVIDLCRTLKNMEVLVYTSTQFSNSNRKDIVIEEKVYRLPFLANDFLNALKKEDDVELDMLYSQCKPEWPNFYTFSKCLAENLIQDDASDMKCAIMRPPLISSIWKKPLPGYAEENSSMAQLSLGIGKGFIRVFFADSQVIMDIMPVDVVANAHIIAAWFLATNRSSSPLVVNCTSHFYYRPTLEELIQVMSEEEKNYPVPKAFRCITTVNIINNFFMYRLLSFYEHYVPAYVMDILMRLSGKKPRLVSLYKFYDKASFTAYTFVSTYWEYETTNLLSLQELDPQDSELFYTDLTGINTRGLVIDVARGSPAMDWSTDKRSKEERLRTSKHRQYLTKSIQYAFLLVIYWLLYKIFSYVIL